MTHGNPCDGLSKEAQAKLRGCETPEEMLALAREEGYELSDEELEGITGGWGCSDNACNCIENWEGCPRAE